MEHRPHSVATQQRGARQRVVPQRPALHPFLKAASVDVLDAEAHCEQRADECSHADPGHAIEHDSRVEQLLEHAQVREGAGAAAREDDPDRASGEPAGDPPRILDHLCGAEHVRLDRDQLLCSPVQYLAAGGDVAGHQIAAVKLGHFGGRPDAAFPGARGQDAIGLLQAEVVPGTGRRERAAEHQHHIARRLRAVEHRPVGCRGGAVGGALAPVQDCARAQLGERRRQASHQLGGRGRIVERDDGDGGWDRALAACRRPGLAQLDGERAGQGDGDLRCLLEQPLEVRLVHDEQIGGSGGSDRRRARGLGQQGQLPDRVAATELTQERARGLVDHLQPAGADDVDGITLLALAKQPPPGLQMDRARPLAQRVALRGRQTGEQGYQAQELRDRLRSRSRRSHSVAHREGPANPRTPGGGRPGVWLAQRLRRRPQRG